MADAGAPVADPRPLLAFPSPTVGRVPPSAARPRYRPVQRPSAARQGTRLTPQFAVLRDALQAQRAQLAESAAAPDPELVAVFDLAGSVEGFMRAVNRITGLEFLTDLQEDRVDPDDDFYYEVDDEVSGEGVPQSLYMVMTNARAVTELVSLFELWQQDQSIKFETGLNPFKEVFGFLRAIRLWGPTDRVRETGLLERWAEDVEVVGRQGATRVEIELWYRTSGDVRAVAQAAVERIVGSAGGTLVSSSQHDAIAYHAVLADIPMAQVERVLADGPGAIELLTANDIMMVAPARPMTFPSSEPSIARTPSFDTSRPAGLPRIALLDGVPLANHVALDGRLVIDDPDDRVSLYSSRQRGHGTAMASLIAHGDLAAPGAAIRQPIYVRPILQPHQFLRHETVPPDELLVDLVHRALRRIFEGDGMAGPAAPSVRIVNLSIGDPARVFVRRLSPLARLLDWLAHSYNAVIVVSAGNHVDLRPAVDAQVLTEPSEAASAVARSLYDGARHRRMLSPAEAINVVTVGATHDDGVSIDLPVTVVDLVPVGTPASYSPVGFGFRRSVKPEVLLPGGRLIFRAPPPGAEGAIEIEPAETVGTGPGMRVAAPGLAGELDGVSYTCGTSNGAALATRTLNGIFDVLEALPSGDETTPFPDAQYHPVLAKTLLVHAAGWHDLLPTMRDLLGFHGPEVRTGLTRLLGYGPVRQDRVASARRARVVLLGAGSIKKDERHSFRFPLPPALSASTEWRRLTITLAWLSPVNVRSQKYRLARLWFRPPRDELAVAPTEGDPNAVLKGTTQHQVLEGTAATAFVAGSSLAIDVDCRSDAGTLQSAVRFGIAASLEVSSAARIDLHEQVQRQLQAQVRDRAGTQVPVR